MGKGGGRLINRKATCLATKNPKSDTFDDLFLAVKNRKIHQKLFGFLLYTFTKSDTFAEI
jgi:hypothetical protein